MCDYTAVTKHIVNKHNRIRHRGLRNICNICGYKEIKLNCDKCDYSTISGLALKKHIQVDHVGVRDPRKFCEFLTTTKKSVLKHPEVGNGTMNFK